MRLDPTQPLKPGDVLPPNWTVLSVSDGWADLERIAAVPPGKENA